MRVDHDGGGENPTHDQLTFRADIPYLCAVGDRQTQTDQAQRQGFEQPLADAVDGGQRLDKVGFKRDLRVHTQQHENSQTRNQRGNDDDQRYDELHTQ